MSQSQNMSVDKVLTDRFIDSTDSSVDTESKSNHSESCSVDSVEESVDSCQTSSNTSDENNSSLDIANKSNSYNSLTHWRGSPLKEVEQEFIECDGIARDEDSDVILGNSVDMQLRKFLPKSFGNKKKKKAKLDKNKIPPNIASNPLLRKFWFRRYSLFSKYDQGIQLDEESWFSITPEKIAEQMAQKCCMNPRDIVVDGFCGCGGNTIQFAKVFDKVIAIDIDPKKIEMCKNNARIYGVEHKIVFVVADFMQIAPYITADIVFLSPPWGGPEYSNFKTFTLSMIPLGGKDVFNAAKKISSNIAYFVPKNMDLDQLTELAGPGEFVELQQNFYMKCLKTITAYYGKLVNNDNPAAT